MLVVGLGTGIGVGIFSEHFWWCPFWSLWREWLIAVSCQRSHLGRWGNIPGIPPVSYLLRRWRQQDGNNPGIIPAVSYPWRR